MKYSMLFIALHFFISMHAVENNWKQDDAIINKTKYELYKSNLDTIRIFNPIGLIFKAHFANCNVMFKDFNSDGLKDLIVYIGGTNYVTQEVFLYDMDMKNFKRVQHLAEMKNTSPMDRPNLFYSVMELYCNGEFWESVLYRIRNYQVEYLGAITAKKSCIGTEKAVPKEGIYINKFINAEPNLIHEFPLDTLDKLPLKKWEFIPKYWNNNLNIYLPVEPKIYHYTTEKKSQNIKGYSKSKK